MKRKFNLKTHKIYSQRLPVENLEQEIDRAKQFGETAFRDGKKSIPALDPNLMEILKDKEVGQGAPLLKAWSEGWSRANLESPIN